MGYMRQLGWAALTLMFEADCTRAAENVSGRPVSEFIFQGKQQTGSRGHLAVTGPGGIDEAIRSLANHSETAICIESAQPREAAVPVPIQIDVKNTTVGAVLEQIVKQDRRYIFRERLGVIEVLPARADRDPNNCLNMVIPKFVADSDWNSMFQSLRCQIDRV